MKQHLELAKSLLDRCIANRLMITTAESCTGGWVAKTLTDLPGSSAIFDRGFVTYSNDAKIEMLDVPPLTIEQWGAVSRQTVMAMTNGALKNSRAKIAVAISGIAGPSGGSQDKPVGTVWFAWQRQDQQAVTAMQRFYGNRDSVRSQAVVTALTGLLELSTVTD